MSIKIQAALRIFRLGQLELADPDPSLPPDEALALYAPNYPQVQGATLAPPEARGDGTLVYGVERAPVATKG